MHVERLLAAIQRAARQHACQFRLCAGVGFRVDGTEQPWIVVYGRRQQLSTGFKTPIPKWAALQQVAELVERTWDAIVIFPVDHAH